MSLKHYWCNLESRRDSPEGWTQILAESPNQARKLVADREDLPYIELIALRKRPLVLAEDEQDGLVENGTTHR